jgi:hypothetical protein
MAARTRRAVAAAHEPPRGRPEQQHGDEPARIRPGAQGGVDAAPVVAEVLRRYYRDRPAPDDDAWERPDDVVSREVDRESGMLSTPWCPPEEVYVEYYLPGTEPVEGCSLHGPWEGRELDPDTLDRR